DGLPRLAWCARLASGSPIVTVTHGPWVETSDAFFVEGVWDGPYDEGRFDRTCAFLGSGSRLVDDKVLFATPGHTLERLHLVRHGPALWVSNSLPFILTAAGLTLDPKYPYYQTDLWSIVHGLDRYVRQIPTREGPAVRLFCYANIEIDTGLGATESAKPA